ncbi:hypothetical protein D3C80_2020160 [compost metagenome]
MCDFQCCGINFLYLAMKLPLRVRVTFDNLTTPGAKVRSHGCVDSALLNSNTGQQFLNQLSDLLRLTWQDSSGMAGADTR